MAKLTAAQLSVENTELHTIVAEAAVTIEQLLATCAAQKAQIAELERIAKVGAYAPKPKAARTPRVVPPEELAQLARMAAAKEAAMANKCSVRV